MLGHVKIVNPCYFIATRGKAILAGVHFAPGGYEIARVDVVGITSLSTTAFWPFSFKNDETDTLSRVDDFLHTQAS